MLSTLSAAYQRAGDFSNALKACKECYAIDEASGDNVRLSSSLNNMACIYLGMKQPKLAEEIILRAIELERPLGRDRALAIRMGIASEIYLKLNNPDKSLQYATEAFRLDSIGDRADRAAVRKCQMANAYAELKQYKRAEQLLEACIPVLEENKIIPSLAIAQLQYGGVLEELNRKDEALKSYLTAADLSSKTGAKYIERNSRYAAYKLLHKQGDARAYEQLVRYTDLNDSIYQEETAHLIDDYYALHKTTEITEENQEHKTKYLYSLIIGIASILVLLALISILLYRYRTQQLRTKLLRETEELRTDFFTNATHELRTPLTVILGLSHDLCHNETLPEDVRKKASAIERQGEGLLLLTNQLLDISKVKSTLGNAHHIHGDLTAFITMMTESYKLLAEQRDIVFTYDAKDAIETDFVPDYIKKIVNNLLSSAFKFTPKGGSIALSIDKTEEMAIIKVSDTGCGIPKESLPHIFEPFYQADSDKKAEGTGVGLALLHQIVELLGGQVSVESKAGKGSQFIVTLPVTSELTDTHPETLKVEPTSTPQPTNEGEEHHDKHQILIVEDNADVAQYIGTQIPKEFDALYATNGEEGLAMAAQNVPDIIITDLMMPGTDGFELCRRIRENEILNHIPIIIISAKITEKDRVEGLEAGADAYLSKPFYGDELRVRIYKLLEQRSMLRDKYAQVVTEQINNTPEPTEATVAEPTVENESDAEEDTMSAADQLFINKIIDNVYLLMEKQQVDVPTIADKLYMSPRQFHRKLVALIGETPAAFIMRIRMAYAKKLIATNEEITFDEVALRCGFDHYSSFYQAFKKVFGETPSHFKQSCK